MTILAQNLSSTSADGELVAASRNGDRQAFGQIVQKYQSMIAGLLYASCGDLHRSEDLAQETFISAWKSLSGLRDAAKLPAWLCQIARHRLLDLKRSAAREDVRMTRAFRSADATPAPSPDAAALSAEEKEVLWRTLSNIEQPYRETLVLYYRWGHSTSDVAAAMETTEANVRQRLTRGREMLREQVAGMIEKNLARSAPNAVFTLAVVAALPALVPATIKAATVGAALKGTAALGITSSILSTLSVVIGPIMGVIGGILGTRAGLQAAESKRERRFIVGRAIFLGLLVLAFMGLLFTVTSQQGRHHWSYATNIMLQAGIWLVYGSVLVVFIINMNRRHRAIRVADGHAPTTQARPVLSRRGQVLMWAGVTIGCFSWMLWMAWDAGDIYAFGLTLAALAILNVIRAVDASRRPPAEAMRGAPIWALLIGAFTLVMINWRLHAWIAANEGMSLEEVHRRVPLWAANVLIGVLWIVIEALMLVQLRMGKADRVANAAAKLSLRP